MADVLLMERAGAVATLTLDRPERKNALSIELRDAISDAESPLSSEFSKNEMATNPTSIPPLIVPTSGSVAIIVGGTTFPGSASGPDGYKWCIGTLAQRQSKLRQAFTNVLDQDVGIVLVK